MQRKRKIKQACGVAILEFQLQLRDGGVLVAAGNIAGIERAFELLAG